MNPMQFIKMMKAMRSNTSPEEIAMQMLGNSNNPLMNNLIKMGKQKDRKGVEEFARNLFKEQGLDFDKEFSEFMQQMK